MKIFFRALLMCSFLQISCSSSYSTDYNRENLLQLVEEQQHPEIALQILIEHNEILGGQIKDQIEMDTLQNKLQHFMQIQGGDGVLAQIARAVINKGGNSLEFTPDDAIAFEQIIRTIIVDEIEALPELDDFLRAFQPNTATPHNFFQTLREYAQTAAVVVIPIISSNLKASDIITLTSSYSEGSVFYKALASISYAFGKKVNTILKNTENRTDTLTKVLSFTFEKVPPDYRCHEIQIMILMAISFALYPLRILGIEVTVPSLIKGAFGCMVVKAVDRQIQSILTDSVNYIDNRFQITNRFRALQDEQHLEDNSIFMDAALYFAQSSDVINAEQIYALLSKILAYEITGVLSKVAWGLIFEPLSIAKDMSFGVVFGVR